MATGKQYDVLPEDMNPVIAGFQPGQIVSLDEDNGDHVQTTPDFNKKAWPRPLLKKVLYVPSSGFKSTGAKFDFKGIEEYLNFSFRDPDNKIAATKYNLSDQTYTNFNQQGGSAAYFEMSVRKILDFFRNQNGREYHLNVLIPVFYSKQANDKVQVPEYIRLMAATTILGNNYPTLQQPENFLRIVELGSRGLFKGSTMAFRGNAHWLYIKKGKLIIFIAKPRPRNRKIMMQHYDTNQRRNTNDLSSKLPNCNKYCRLVLEPGDSIFIPPSWIIGYYFLEDSLLFRSLYYPIMCPEAVAIGLDSPDMSIEVIKRIEPTILQLTDYINKLHRLLPMLVSDSNVLKFFPEWHSKINQILENVSAKLDDPANKNYGNPWITTKNTVDVPERVKLLLRQACQRLLPKIKDVNELYETPLICHTYAWISKLQSYVIRSEMESMNIRIDKYLQSVGATDFVPIHFAATFPNFHDRVAGIDQVRMGHDLKILEPPPNGLTGCFQNMLLYVNKKDKNQHPYLTLIEEMKADMPIGLLAGVWITYTDFQEFEDQRANTPFFQFPENNLVFDTSRASNWAVLLKETREPNCIVQFFEMDGNITPCLMSLTNIQPGVELSIPIGNKLSVLDTPYQTDIRKEKNLRKTLYHGHTKAPTLDQMLCRTDPSYISRVNLSGSLDIEPKPREIRPFRQSTEVKIEYDDYGRELSSSQAERQEPVAGPSSASRPQCQASTSSGRGSGRGIPRLVLAQGYGASTGRAGGQGLRGARIVAPNAHTTLQLNVPGARQASRSVSPGRARTHSASAGPRLVCRLPPTASILRDMFEDRQVAQYRGLGISLFSREQSTVHRESHETPLQRPGSERVELPDSTPAPADEDGTCDERLDDQDALPSRSGIPLWKRAELHFPNQVDVGCLGPWILESDPDFNNLILRNVLPTPNHIWAPNGEEIRVEEIRSIEPNDPEEPGTISGIFPIISQSDLHKNCEIPVTQRRHGEHSVKCGLETCRKSRNHQTAKHTIFTSDKKKKRTYSQLRYGHNIIYHRPKEESMKYRCIFCKKFKYRSQRLKSDHEDRCYANPDNHGSPDLEDEEEDEDDEDDKKGKEYNQGLGRRRDDNMDGNGGTGGSSLAAVTTTRSRTKKTGAQ